MQRLLKKLLELDEHDVIVAKSGDEAWEIYQKEPVRLVLSEWSMPGMNGLDLVLRIRNMESPSYTYVIMMTAKSEKACVAQALAAGADDFISKPINRTELRWRLRSGLRVLSLGRESCQQDPRDRRSEETHRSCQPKNPNRSGGCRANSTSTPAERSTKQRSRHLRLVLSTK
jgi:sigma-B regulation protein RsbU (phosphoserine phosphatase)